MADHLTQRRALPNVYSISGSGSDPVEEFKDLLSFVLTVTIFGAGLLSTIVSGIADPAETSSNPRFTKNTVRLFLSISWLLFLVALAIGSLARAVFAYREEYVAPSKRGPPLFAGSVLQLLILGAFFFLALAVLAYEEVVGWVAVGVTIAAAGVVLALLAIQWNTLRTGQRGRDQNESGQLKSPSSLLQKHSGLDPYDKSAA